MSHTLSTIRELPNHKLYKLKLVHTEKSVIVVAVLTQKAVTLGVRFDNDRKDYRFNLSEYLGNDDGKWCRGTNFNLTAKGIYLDLSDRENRCLVANLEIEPGSETPNRVKYNLDEALGLVDYFHPVARETYFRLGVKEVRGSPRRTLVLCFDGTSNHFNRQNTNVVKMFELLKKDDPERQMVYYQTGVGTYTSLAWANTFLEGIANKLDEGVAWYLYQHVIDGYKFLMETYRDGDKICLFGFSRGAYTARALAGMLHCVGLLPRHNVEHVAFAYQIYASGGRKKSLWQRMQSRGIKYYKSFLPPGNDQAKEAKEEDGEAGEQGEETHEGEENQEGEPDGDLSSEEDFGGDDEDHGEVTEEVEPGEAEPDQEGANQEDSNEDELETNEDETYEEEPNEGESNQDMKPKKDKLEKTTKPDKKVSDMIVPRKASDDAPPPLRDYNPTDPKILYRAYGALGEGGDSNPKNAVPEAYKQTFCTPITIDFVGVWDTVGSVGALIPQTLPFIDYNPSIKIFRHALALDEHRANFVPSLWDHAKTRQGQNVREVWFRGQHSDVGGGSPPPLASRDTHSSNFTKLCNIPLRWMVQQCLENDLSIVFDRWAMYLYRNQAVLEWRPTQLTLGDYDSDGLKRLDLSSEWDSLTLKKIKKGEIPMPERMRNTILYKDAAFACDRLDIDHEPYDCAAGFFSPWNILEFFPSTRPAQTETGPKMTHWPNCFQPRVVWRRNPADPIYLHASVVDFLQTRHGGLYEPKLLWRGYEHGEYPLIESFEGADSGLKSYKEVEAVKEGLNLGWNRPPELWRQVKDSVTLIVLGI
ncbi:unnamed protein product [Rhizoctonia solani]|uniref:T6SS Phospholipase effector Tle1-like catalytic domain-containing protein n=1 Tax=Rhizoctonia solani TaxID=456999 RepID=A0A8H3I0I8_9AGAM|nr:unnamed protein product [Rhizoctonia solani]